MPSISLNPIALDSQEIARRVPHAGTMCLLQSVSAWDEEQIVATALSHPALDHPLRYNGRLSSLCAVEYAGQAMALHGSLLAGTVDPQPGFLASLREVSFQCAWLDDLPLPLRISARKLGGDHSMVLYAFEVSSGESAIAVGRMAIAFATANS
jgi:predicted hotdog family 3-hydroxylacyl-ACP dehydratase